MPWYNFSGGQDGLGAVGGAATVQLTLSQMPSHRHETPWGMVEKNSTTLPHNNDDWGFSGRNYSVGGSSGLAGGKNGNTEPHENRPPYYALYFIMKIQA